MDEEIIRYRCPILNFLFRHRKASYDRNTSSVDVLVRLDCNNKQPVSVICPSYSDSKCLAKEDTAKESIYKVQSLDCILEEGFKRLKQR